MSLLPGNWELLHTLLVFIFVFGGVGCGKGLCGHRQIGNDLFPNNAPLHNVFYGRSLFVLIVWMCQDCRPADTITFQFCQLGIY